MEFRRRESIACKAETPDILSFFWFAFTYNIKSSSVINIVGTCFLSILVFPCAVLSFSEVNATLA
jgi:hypothetical protein